MTEIKHEHDFVQTRIDGNVCECGAKLVVVPAPPVMVNCYWGVIGHAGHRKYSLPCHNQIVKGTEPPYCSDHCDMKKMEDAIQMLKGRMIREITFIDSEVTIMSESDTDRRIHQFSVDVNRYSDYDDHSWSVYERKVLP